MKILHFLVAMLLFVSCSPNINIYMPESSTKTYNIKQAHKSVGGLVVDRVDKLAALEGTAFAIGRDYLLTAGHICVATLEGQANGILEDHIRLRIIKDGIKGEINNIKIVELDELHDICLLKKKNHGLVPLELADYSIVKFNDTVWIVGTPFGMMLSSQQGEVMDVDLQYPDPLKGRLLASVAVAGGNSGSPIINEQGKVIGMAVVHLTQIYDHLAVCVKSSALREFLDATGHKGIGKQK